jgi:hypothetical protein
MTQKFVFVTDDGWNINSCTSVQTLDYLCSTTTYCIYIYTI